MIDTNPVAPPRVRPLPGTGRLGVVSAFSGLFGLAGAYYVAMMLRPAAESSILSTVPWTALSATALMTFGFFRTYGLLQKRRRSGALLAALCLGGWVVTSITTGHHGILEFGMPLLGLALLGSVWRHLE